MLPCYLAEVLSLVIGLQGSSMARHCGWRRSGSIWGTRHESWWGDGQLVFICERE